MTGSLELRAIVAAVIEAADPRPCVRAALDLVGDELKAGNFRFRLAGDSSIILIAAGKAAYPMTLGALDVLGERVRGGIVTTKDGHSSPDLPSSLDIWEAGHPAPDARSLAAAAETLRIARAAREDDLVLCLLSGGASALWAAPPVGVSLGDLQRITASLLRSATPIEELNTVRKHLSVISGGRLARAVAPAQIVTLAVSDVVGSAPDVIASGPTVPDPTTFAEAIEILERRGIAVGPAVRRYLEAGARGEVPETPEPGEIDEPRVCVIMDNESALDSAARSAREFGYAVEIVDDRLAGEAREVAREIVARARAALASGSRVALIWGGETTVTVTGDGRGGRNQEAALAAAIEMEGTPGITIGAFGTDGTDGPTNAAGGIVDGETASRGRAAGLDPQNHLDRNDSYAFLHASGDLLITGPTRTNVNDVIVALVGARA